MENKIIIGSDHAAFPLKENLKHFLEKKGFCVTDIGAFSEESVHYPNIAVKVAQAISSSSFSQGILLCGTGQGMTMVANRFPRVRASLCNDLFSAIMARRHNNANILTMGGRMLSPFLAQTILETWLNTSFEGGRHEERLQMFEVLDVTPDSQNDPVGSYKI